jgi:biopolymer transport protein ExbD
MGKFKKKRGLSNPEVSTASLPDIIFMLLFFFMVVTVLRDAEIKVTNNVPSATELTKLEKKSLVNYLYVGKPLERYQATYGTKPRLQLGDKFADISEIPLYLEKHRSTVPEVQRPAISSSLRVDGKVTMGIVTDVKTQLRKAGQLKINYSAKKRVD